jgi:hypothetical protein
MELNLPAPDKTLEAVDQAIIAANPASVRTYIQCSNLGKDCERDLWYGWRWTIPVTFDAPTLRRFGDGFAGEELMATRLRAVPGIKLQTHYEDGSQFEVHDMGGHLLGHLDGVIEGVAAAPKTMHVWEHKQVQQKTFNKLEKLKRELGEKESLENWSGTYFGQAQLYMHLTKLTRHYLPHRLRRSSCPDVPRESTAHLRVCRSAAKNFQQARLLSVSLVRLQGAVPRHQGRPGQLPNVRPLNAC